MLGPASLPTLQISHWRGIREVLEANGAEVFIGRVPATSSIEERAKILKEEIEKKFEGREVNLVGHSMVCGSHSSSINQVLTFSLVSMACREGWTVGTWLPNSNRWSSKFFQWLRWLLLTEDLLLQTIWLNKWLAVSSPSLSTLRQD